jgi:5-methylcytosine-specific restriction endonuclease McrA
MARRPNTNRVTVRSIETGEVIRVEGRVPTPEPVKRAIWARDGLCCRYCGFWSLEDPSKFELDHVRPVAHGGETSVENMVVACRRCNRLKRDQLGWEPLSVAEAKRVRRSRRWALSEGRRFSFYPSRSVRGVA